MLTTVRHKDGISILAPPRAIIGEAVPELRQVLMQQIDKPRVPRILIDFCRVRKIDSGGLGMLVNAYCMTKSKAGRIGVINVGQNINNLILRTRLINVFEHFKNEDMAVSGLLTDTFTSNPSYHRSG